MHGLLLNANLGLGDAIICNALIRRLAAQEEFVALPVKYNNLPSVAYMLRDVSNVVLRPVEDDCDALNFSTVWKGRRKCLGAFLTKFPSAQWDKDFYDQANVPFEDRWTAWRCKRDKAQEIANSVQPSVLSWCFFHEDKARGLLINRYPELIPPTKVRPDPGLSPNLFAWWSVIEQAPIIHCISSSFALFIDSIPLVKNPQLFIHQYARAAEPLPTLKKDWKILT